jgi:hypothetical protein
MSNIPAVEMQRLFASTEELINRFAEPKEGKAIRDLVRRTKTLSIELMRDNEQLRKQNLVLERQKTEAEQRLDHSRLGIENEELKADLEMLNARLKDTEKKSARFLRRYEDIEQYNMALSNVYIAANHLHSTLDFSAVVKMAEEILWNFVASPVFAIFLLDDKSKGLELVGGQGIDGRFPSGIVHEPTGMIAEALTGGSSVFLEGVNSGDPLACVPLKVADRGVVGLVVVYAIEEHKDGLTDLDKELFELLANQTATAMTSSRVYSETVKKLKSMESFLSLIKPE